MTKIIQSNYIYNAILNYSHDLIEINGIEGFVKDISIRETLLKTPDGKDVFLPNSIILKNPLFNYTIDGYLRYEFMVGITFDNNPTETIRLILETVNKVEGVLKSDKKPTIMISELGANLINIRVLFWVDTFKSTRRSVHHSIRSKVMNDVVVALIANGISMPAYIGQVKNIEPSPSLSPKVGTSEDEITKP